MLELTPYALVGGLLWVAILNLGFTPRSRGSSSPFFIPFQKRPGEDETQLEVLEHDLHPLVAYVILPIFAFANAGIPLEAMSLEFLLHPVPLGIATGLFFGNQIGIFSLSWLAVKSGLCRLPEGVTWIQVYGAALLCGIGFTMSLFVGSLAFDQAGTKLDVDYRAGIVVGSLISGLAGFFLLRFTSKVSDDQPA